MEFCPEKTHTAAECPCPAQPTKASALLNCWVSPAAQEGPLLELSAEFAECCTSTHCVGPYCTEVQDARHSFDIYCKPAGLRLSWVDKSTRVIPELHVWLLTADVTVSGPSSLHGVSSLLSPQLPEIRVIDRKNICPEVHVGQGCLFQQIRIRPQALSQPDPVFRGFGVR